MTKYVYSFGRGKAEGSSRDAQPARRQGLRARRDDQPRHPGSARLHDHHRRRGPHYNRGGRQCPDGLWEQVARAPRTSSSRTPGSCSAIRKRPLLVSVRSGARVSMPGMMETVLNLGLNDETVEGLAALDAATSASPGTATAASSRCSATWCSGIQREAFDEQLDAAQDAARRARPIPRCRPPSCASSSQAFKDLVQDAHRPAVPAGPARAARAWPSTPSSTPGSPRRRSSTGASTTSRPTGARR